MTLFVDASALVSMLANEPDAQELKATLQDVPKRVTSAIALWEVARALATFGRTGMEQALAETNRFCSMLGITLVSISAAEAVAAVDAQVRYGKGTGHPARLNMGDCFAYACAKANGAKLLYKGNDFSHTDLA